MKCDYCLNSRPIVSENGIHNMCCLSVKAEKKCLTGEKEGFVMSPAAYGERKENG